MRRTFILCKEALLALNVAEKNSVCRSVTEILSQKRFSLGNSLSKYNPVYKFSFDLDDKKYDMNFTSVRGHLIGYEFPSNCRLWNINRIKKLYEQDPVKLIKPADLPIKKNIESLAKKADLLILWLDCDREGENIAYEVIEIVQAVNPKIKILRAHFSALTQKDIMHAIENLQEPNKNLSDAVELRQKMDLILGASFTRLQTLYFRKIFEKYIDLKEIKKFSKPSYETNYQGSNKQSSYKNKINELNYKMIISYGPCQFPTLNFIVERNDEIKNFISKDFYSIVFNLHRASSMDPNNIVLVEFNWTKERLYDKLLATQLMTKLQNIYKQEKDALKITEVKAKIKIRKRPFPLNTVEMQKLASRKLKMQSHRTMTIAEKLYNMGYISYPRTETQIYSKSENLQKKVEELCLHKNDDEFEWIKYGKSLLESSKTKFVSSEGKLNDNSHPPISPVKYANKSDLNHDEYKIYNLIVLHFLATVSEDAKGEEKEIKLQIEDEIFTCKGFNLQKKGYLEIYHYEEWNDKIIPEFTQGEIIEYDVSNKFDVTEGKTKPPPQMTEAELIELMDKHGIGTDATIHEHIKTIKERNYAVQIGSVLKPTIFGLALIKAYQSLGIEIYKPNLRASMEKDLMKICKGELAADSLFYQVRKESLNFYELVEKKIQLIQYNLECYLSNGTKKDDYARLEDNPEDIKNNVLNNNYNNNIDELNKHKEDKEEFFDTQIKNNSSKVNLKVDFSRELEENEKSKALNEEIISTILSPRSSKKQEKKMSKDKFQFENNLRGILKLDKKKDQPDSSDESDSDSDQPKESENSLVYKNDILELNYECPACKAAKLKLLKNKKTLTYFIGCSGFPDCSYSKSINNPTKIKISDEYCQKCKENNQNNLLFELQFENLKNKDKDHEIDECFVCLLEKDKNKEISPHKIYNKKTYSRTFHKQSDKIDYTQKKSNYNSKKLNK